MNARICGLLIALTAIGDVRAESSISTGSSALKAQASINFKVVILPVISVTVPTDQNKQIIASTNVHRSRVSVRIDDIYPETLLASNSDSFTIESPVRYVTGALP